MKSAHAHFSIFVIFAILGFDPKKGHFAIFGVFGGFWKNHLWGPGGAPKVLISPVVGDFTIFFCTFLPKVAKMTLLRPSTGFSRLFMVLSRGSIFVIFVFF